MSAWIKKLCALLLVCVVSGCYVPVASYDFSNLSDNVVDASIKKHFHFYPGTTNEVFDRYRKGLREDFLTAFPQGSPAEVAVTYMTSIGSQCHEELQQRDHKTYQCQYDKAWKQYLKHLISREFTSDKIVTFNFSIESSSGKIEDVIVDFKMKDIPKKTGN